MKYLGKVKDANKLMFEVKGGEKKAFECSEEVIAYAKANFKAGDGVACGEGKTTFTKGVITKLVKWEPRQKQSSGSDSPKGDYKKGGYNKGGYQKSNYNSKNDASIVRQVLLKAATEVVIAGKNIEDVIKAYLRLREAIGEDVLAVVDKPVPQTQVKSQNTMEIGNPVPVTKATPAEESLESDEPEVEDNDPSEALEEEEYN